MENLENENKRKTLRNYKDFKEDNYKYRVDEILDYICSNDNELIELFDKRDIKYNELRKTLGKEEKKLLLEYADIEVDILSYENYNLAKQIYEDLER